MSRLIRGGTLTAAVFGAWAGPAWAQAPLDDADVILSVQGGTITTGRVELLPQGMQAVVPERVFFAPLNEFGSTANPGFDSFAGTFVPGSRVGFDILQTLRVWDGDDFDRAAVAPADPALRVNFGPLIRFAPATDQVVAGILLTASGGLFHNHYSFTILSQAQPPAEVPDPGIYLLAMQMVSTDPAAGPSEPFYFVLSHASPESEAQEAIDWVRVNLLAPPGPAGCTVADIADGFGQTIADGGGPDGVLDVSDLFAYLGAFELGILSVADIADGFGQTIENGAGPDGNLDVSDLFAFLDDFAAINPDCL